MPRVPPPRLPSIAMAPRDGSPLSNEGAINPLGGDISPRALGGIAPRAPIVRDPVHLFGPIPDRPGNGLGMVYRQGVARLVGLCGCRVTRLPIGAASFHFEGPLWNCINYKLWKEAGRLLDNDKPLPEKKIFVNDSYDHATRTFTGTIDWSPTSFEGACREEYVIVFEDDLGASASGQVRTYAKDGALVRECEISDKPRDSNTMALTRHRSQADTEAEGRRQKAAEARAQHSRRRLAQQQNDR